MKDFFIRSLGFLPLSFLAHVSEEVIIIDGL